MSNCIFLNPVKSSQAFLDGRAEFQRTCHMAPMPMQRIRIRRGQSIHGIRNRSPIRMVPVTKGQKKQEAKDSFHLLKRSLPTQSAT